MADIVLQKSIGELEVPKVLSKSSAWTAGGTSDAVQFFGTSIDRMGFSTGSLPRTVDVVIPWDATIASGATLSLTLTLQDSADNSSFADFATEGATVVATGNSGGTRQQGVARLTVASSDKPTGTPGVSLGGARRYVRLGITPDLSASGTDTGIVQGLGIFAGFDQLASPQS